MVAIQCIKNALVFKKLHPKHILKRFSTKPQLQNDREISNRMLAWQINSYGGLESVQLSTSARVPLISKPKDVLIKVAAASVNPLDVAMLENVCSGDEQKVLDVAATGSFISPTIVHELEMASTRMHAFAHHPCYVTDGYGSSILNIMRTTDRLCGTSGSSVEFPLTLGRDFVGEVVECGLGVRGLQAGDWVWGVVPPQQQGSHAEMVITSAANVCKSPKNLNIAEAASLPYVAMTAWSALWLSAGLCVWSARGRRVLVLGGSGGVGTAALQMLKAWGAQVVTTCSEDAVPLLESLGADAVVDYTKPESERQIKEEGPYDIILNCSGKQGAPYEKCLKEWRLARYVTVTSPLLRNTDKLGFVAGGIKSALDLFRPNIQTITSKGASVRWAFFAPSQSGLKQVTELAREGKLCPVIDKVYNFANLPAAYQHQIDGHVRGKIVVSMAPEAVPSDNNP